MLVFGALLIALFLGFAIVQGLGDPSVPAGDVAVIEDAPDGLGTITEREFERTLELTAVSLQVKPVPKPGDERYDELKEEAFEELLDRVWIQGEAEELGISLTAEEFSEEFEKLKNKAFGSEAEYRKFLRESKLTQPEVDELVEVQLLSDRIQKQATGVAPVPSEAEIEEYYEAAKSTQFLKGDKVQSLEEVEPEIERQLSEQAQQEKTVQLIRDYTGRWTSRTFCAPDFTTEKCANFQPSAHPAGASPACYEADPKEGTPEACPAPVQQLTPALPGSIDVLTPQGQKLPQRPRSTGDMLPAS